MSPGIISNRSQNARSMAHSLLTHSVSLSVVQFVVVGRSRQIKLSGGDRPSRLHVIAHFSRIRADFAHLTAPKKFAMLTSFRAFAPKTAEFRLLPTHEREQVNRQAVCAQLQLYGPTETSRADTTHAKRPPSTYSETHLVAQNLNPRTPHAQDTHRRCF